MKGFVSILVFLRFRFVITSHTNMIRLMENTFSSEDNDFEQVLGGGVF